MICSDCHERRIALWNVDGTTDMVCLACLFVALNDWEIPPILQSIEDIVRRITGDQP